VFVGDNELVGCARKEHANNITMEKIKTILRKVRAVVIFPLCLGPAACGSAVWTVVQDQVHCTRFVSEVHDIEDYRTKDGLASASSFASLPISQYLHTLYILEDFSSMRCGGDFDDSLLISPRWRWYSQYSFI
jgi:hypothetical protein